MASKTLVTGASGFIGHAIVRELLKQGKSVRVLIRKNSILGSLEKLDIEKVYGDLREIDSLKKALQGCETLYHAAAQYTLWNPNPTEMYEVNVEGTRNLLSIALKKEISKVVYTSTVGTLELPKNRTAITENSPADFKNCKGHYKKSKIMAEQIALRFAKKGLPIVIVNPTAPVGEEDVKPTPTGRIIVDFCKKKMVGYTSTGLNLVYVKDVAKGHILAAEKGRIGERYILGNKNLSLKEILDLLSGITGIKSPKINIPHSLIYTAAIGNEILSRLFTQSRPFISLEEAQLAKHYMYFDSSKAIRELGFKQTDIKVALKRAVDWFQKKGYV